jgi:hypothetical protein
VKKSTLNKVKRQAWRNIDCSKYLSCLTHAAIRDQQSTPCETCSMRDDKGGIPHADDEQVHLEALAACRLILAIGVEKLD